MTITGLHHTNRRSDEDDRRKRRFRFPLIPALTGTLAGMSIVSTVLSLIG